MAALTDFLCKKKFKFPTNSVTISGEVTDFSHCVHILAYGANANFNATEKGHFFDSWNSNGKRCQFFDKDGNNLPYEVEYYNASSGSEEAVYWVKKSVAASVDGTNNYIYIGYGNDPNSSDQDSASNAWKSDFKLVTHLKDITTSTVNDSTSNANHGTKKAANEPVEATGQVYKGQDFDGSNDYVDFGDIESSIFDGSESKAVMMASINPSALSGLQTVLSKYRSQATIALTFLFALTDAKLRATYYASGVTTSYIDYTSDNNVFSNGTTYRVAVMFDLSSETIKLYVGGSEVAATKTKTGTGQPTVWPNNSTPFRAGCIHASSALSAFFSGVMDEIRLIKGNTGYADWIKLDYYSMAKTNWNGDGWYSWDAEEVASTVIARDAILHGLDTYDMERDAILRGYVDRDIERDFILEGQIESARDFILRGFDNIDRGFILSGESHLDDAVWFILRGLDARDSERDFIIRGLDGLGRDFIIPAMPNIEAAFIIRGDEILPAWKTKRLTLLDTLNLRTTAVYRNPRDISVLQIVCGDFMQSRIPCTPLDRDGYIHHVSDRPMQMIDKVYADNEPVAYGYRAHAAYQDETGQRISCVIFDNPQYDKKISVTGRGAFRTDSPAAELIENPADLIRFLFLDVQGYDTSSIDLAELSRFYADGLAAEMKVAALLNDFRTIKAFLDELADNIHSQWMISDGKSVMRYRWL